MIRIGLLLLTGLTGLAGLAAGDWRDDLPARARPGVEEPLVDAIQVWRLGGPYVEGVAWPEPPAEQSGSLPFLGLDRATAWWLRAGRPDSAVQFSGARTISLASPEGALRRALGADRPAALRLLALSILVKKHAPRSAVEQWEALQSLRGLEGHPGAGWLLGELEAEFAPKRVRALLERPAPEERYEGDRTLEWAARVAGVRGDVASIPRLVELATGDNLHASLAAVQGLIDLPGPAAEQGLARTVEGWRYDAFLRAGNALLRRDPALLERTLLAMPVPERSAYLYATLLGRCGNPAAVPLICDTVRGVRRLDREMFDLVEQLATAGHRVIVEALPGRVREDQRERAIAVRDAVRARLR